MKNNAVNETCSSPILCPPSSVCYPRNSHFGRDEFILDKFLLGEFTDRVGMFDGMDVEAVGDDWAWGEVSSQVD
jgi:hypothetical protein